ncbi:glycogenin-1-like isoform X3 [Neoarius graeffei]|uniref:glycogenin-1-like isoform X3 n=1 Tax=Neoarius graeffei TaxID=443677 RepID=UPI00298C4772|nr:glycogenin-1-like isoform X3 [Neoarius graeffei]
MICTDQAFITLATNDSYAKGAMVLGVCLRNHKTSRNLVVLIGDDVSQLCRSVLSQIFDEVCEVSVLDSGDAARLAMMKRPELGVTLTKLHCWNLTHYSKCVFMDADTLVLCNIDELFEREEFSAAPDPGWPDCFNSGVFVFQPSEETYARLLTAGMEHGSFDGGDQGVLNSYFSDWATADIAKHLPFIYNLSSVSIYTYLPAFRQFGHNAKVIHFLGEKKPWDYHHGDDEDDEECSSETGPRRSSSLYPDYFQQWWSVFKSSVLPLLSKEHTHPLSDTPSMEVTLYITASRFFRTMHDHNRARASQQESVYVEAAQQEECIHPPAPRTSSQDRKQKWEQGDADYLGEDSFTQIERKLDSFLK